MVWRSFDFNLLIGGEAGQGMQTLGVFLSKALLRGGHYISTLQSYMSRIRGGHNYFQIRVASEPIHSMTRKQDVVLALDSNTVSEHAVELPAGGMLMFDSSGKAQAAASAVTRQDIQHLGVPVADLFPEARKTEVFANSVYLGVLAGLLGLDPEEVKKQLAETFGKKGGEIILRNEAAFDAGLGFVRKLPGLEGKYTLHKPGSAGRYLALHGNEAIGLGAMAAGCKFYTAYPMTPSSSILDTLAHHMLAAGVVVEQAEDEVAALNMVLGASYAGVRAMTGTSGGGFALMVEALSLAGMSETPAVIALAQRPGPATGLPTRTEQGELEFVIRAGHGEFPRAVFAPGTAEDCFYLTQRAFNLADKYQIPAFVLTDQYLADLYSNVPELDLNRIPTDRGKIVSGQSDYVRYQWAADGVSPRAFPGAGPGLVILDSDEHTEDGHLTEDLEVRKKMAEKRLKKNEGLTAECLQPEISGEAKDHLVLCWGSTFGVCLDAVRRLQQQGRSVSLLHFKQVWPLNGEKLKAQLAPYQNLIMVENNATGQMARLLHAETSIGVPHKILKYDGKPFLLEELLEELKKILS